jgi:hypothetical protein
MPLWPQTRWQQPPGWPAPPRGCGMATEYAVPSDPGPGGDLAGSQEWVDAVGPYILGFFGAGLLAVAAGGRGLTLWNRRANARWTS